MTLRYEIFGIPGNVGEFAEKAQRRGVKELNMYPESYLKVMSSDDGTEVEKLVLDSGKGLIGRKFNLVKRTCSSHFTHETEWYTPEKKLKRAHEREEVAGETSIRLREEGFDVNLDPNYRDRGIVTDSISVGWVAVISGLWLAGIADKYFL